MPILIKSIARKLSDNESRNFMRDFGVQAFAEKNSTSESIKIVNAATVVEKDVDENGRENKIQV